jgi:hypothetical protein
MLFGHKRIPKSSTVFQISIDGAVLQEVQCTKFLGVIIDNKLNWSLHLNHIASQIAKSIGIIAHIRKILPPHILLLLYHTLIYPYLTYCCILWGNGCKTVLRKVTILQKHAIRLVCNAGYRSSTGPRFFGSKLLKLDDIF